MACCFSNYKQLFPAGNFSMTGKSLAPLPRRHLRHCTDIGMLARAAIYYEATGPAL